MHLGHDPTLLRVVMKAVRAGDQVKSVVGEGEVFAVSLNPVRSAMRFSTATLASPEHPGTQVQADHLDVGEALDDPGGEPIRAATDVQDPPISESDPFE
jgi:hypothetical protein